MGDGNKMKRRTFLKTGAAATAAAALGVRPGLSMPAILKDRPPNILFILTDQQHPDAVGAFGKKQLNTPAMDYLYQQGTNFTQSYCPNPICSPSRSSLFTGRMPSETGVWKNGSPVDEHIPNIGQWLREKSSYETYYAGKWHLPDSWTFDIPGFDVLTPGVFQQGLIGDAMTADACAGFLKNRQSDKPFLLVASMLQPHDICQWLRLNEYSTDEIAFPEPLPPLPSNHGIPDLEPDEIIAVRQVYEPASSGWSDVQWQWYIYNYLRMVEMVDAETAKVMDALQGSRFADNTIVIFSSDHGEGSGHHSFVRKNTLYDEAARVPLIIHDPVKGAGKQSVSVPVSGADIVPTICSYSGVEPPSNMRGTSLQPIVQKSSRPDREFIVTELSADRNPVELLGRMVRTHEYKYNVHPAGGEQLFDMINDPGETRNLAVDDKLSATLDQHRKMLRQWESRLELSKNLPPHKRWPA